MVKVIGAGLAGSEAAWQLANRGLKVTLYEMKPHKKSPAHHADTFAELVCSNSLRADGIANAVGLLKEELRRLGSLIMQCADATRVEAGGGRDAESCPSLVALLPACPRPVSVDAQAFCFPCSGLSAFFLLSSPYPRPPTPS